MYLPHSFVCIRSTSHISQTPPPPLLARKNYIAVLCISRNLNTTNHTHSTHLGLGEGRSVSVQIKNRPSARPAVKYSLALFESSSLKLKGRRHFCGYRVVVVTLTCSVRRVSYLVTEKVTLYACPHLQPNTTSLFSLPVLSRTGGPRRWLTGVFAVAAT